jgi:hypothetical protein
MNMVDKWGRAIGILFLSSETMELPIFHGDSALDLYGLAKLLVNNRI